MWPRPCCYCRDWALVAISFLVKGAIGKGLPRNTQGITSVPHVYHTYVRWVKMFLSLLITSVTPGKTVSFHFLASEHKDLQVLPTPVFSGALAMPSGKIIPSVRARAHSCASRKQNAPLQIIRKEGKMVGNDNENKSTLASSPLFPDPSILLVRSTAP